MVRDLCISHFIEVSEVIRSENVQSFCKHENNTLHPASFMPMDLCWVLGSCVKGHDDAGRKR